MRVRTGGAWKEVSGGRVRVAGAWKNLVRIRAYIGGAWKDVASFTQPLSLSLTPETLFTEGGTGVDVVSIPMTATPTGGRAPYSYSYTFAPGGEDSIEFTSVSGATARLRITVLVTGVFTRTAICTCTDADGQTASDTTSATFNIT